MSTVIYIGIANIAGVFGFTPPTKDMNVTIAFLLILVIFLIGTQVFTNGDLKVFCIVLQNRFLIMLPINILELGNQADIIMYAIIW